MKITRDYYPIADAARMIGCTEDDLIHLGANHKLNIWALFSPAVRGERDDALDLELDGPRSCYGVGPFLLSAHELRALEAGNTAHWCRTVWQEGQDNCQYAFALLEHDDPDAEFPRPSKLIVMSSDIARLTGMPDSVVPDEGEENEEPMASPPQQSCGVTVTLPHLSKSLEAVLNIMWDNWNAPDPKRRPKQVNIAREIDAALGYRADGDEPSRNAKAIAAIIKPDTVSDPA